MPFDKRIDFRLVFASREERKAEEADKAVFVPRGTLEVRETEKGSVYVMHNGGAILMKETATPQKAYAFITAKRQSRRCAGPQASRGSPLAGGLLSAPPNMISHIKIVSDIFSGQLG